MPAQAQAQTGGEGASAPPPLDSHGMDPNVLVSVQPRRGRLLLFPHAAPHEGCPVQGQGQEQGPIKLLLRGEAL